MNKNKNLGFTLAEVLIVIGIIGVVAALTLPNLNHATGDKETITRLQKAYSILNEANDRAVAIYGPVSTWKSNEQCANNLGYCWMKRIGEFLKISKSCNEAGDEEDGTYSNCDALAQGDFDHSDIVYQLADGIAFSISQAYSNCNSESGSIGGWFYINDLCADDIAVDINSSSKGKNVWGQDIFRFMLSNSIGILPYKRFESLEEAIGFCVSGKDYDCAFWPLEFGNLDYLKADEDGKCPNGTQLSATQTSCN